MNGFAGDLYMIRYDNTLQLECNSTSILMHSHVSAEPQLTIEKIYTASRTEPHKMK